ncbi:hypothetical protein GCM10022255_081200 [Dactylosporangium darangshiense]|uniref:Uncharacterized protein n=1 Tax=Dactylosporangium darangshiense TaxID=579108 RepID=A0ABP8DLA7_9ACTN
MGRVGPGPLCPVEKGRPKAPATIGRASFVRDREKHELAVCRGVAEGGSAGGGVAAADEDVVTGPPPDAAEGCGHVSGTENADAHDDRG